MAQSMTGFASALAESENHRINVEIKTVNNRFLNINFKLPFGFEPYESHIKSLCQKSIKRGSVTVFLKHKSLKNADFLKIDEQAARESLENMRQFSINNKIDSNITMDTLLKVQGVLKHEDSKLNVDDNKDTEEVLNTINSALHSGLKKLQQARGKEGQELIDCMSVQCENLSQKIKKIKSLQDSDNNKYFLNLKDKVDKIINEYDIKLEQKDVVKELAIISEKADIIEEIDRVEIHLKELNKILNISNSEVGKKIDFLCQELNRELNTICSKTKNILITQEAMDGKLDIEKIKEQTQNLE